MPSHKFHPQLVQLNYLATLQLSREQTLGQIEMMDDPTQVPIEAMPIQEFYSSILNSKSVNVMIALLSVSAGLSKNSVSLATTEKSL